MKSFFSLLEEIINHGGCAYGKLQNRSKVFDTDFWRKSVEKDVRT